MNFKRKKKRKSISEQINTDVKVTALNDGFMIGMLSWLISGKP